MIVRRPYLGIIQKKIFISNFCLLDTFVICLTATLGEKMCHSYDLVTVLFPDGCVSSTGQVIPAQETIHMSLPWAYLFVFTWGEGRI